MDNWDKTRKFLLNSNYPREYIYKKMLAEKNRMKHKDLPAAEKAVDDAISAIWKCVNHKWMHLTSCKVFPEFVSLVGNLSAAKTERERLVAKYRKIKREMENYLE